METDAERIGRGLLSHGRSLAVAESLTGGMLASRFAAAPSASEWFRGAIVAYSSEVKYDLLKVPEGPVVSEPAAEAMAEQTAHLLGGDVALAVTGVGGPDPQDGEKPGTVWVATWPAKLGTPQLLHLSGDPTSICEQACGEAIRLLRRRLDV